ncbi:MAG: proprotein convertase, P [Novosphingobium sp.]|nr:proprotein convertase, P [Novosphingobium sp.]
MLTLLALAGWSAPAMAQTVTRYTNTTDSPTNAINETNYLCPTVFTRSFSVGTSYTVSDVNVAVLMSHTWRSDILMSLVSPGGTRVQLTNGQGADADNFNLTFDDEAASAISAYTANSTATATTAVPPYSASFRPTVALSAFDGSNSAGNWTLEICDSANADSGTFFQADLYLTQSTVTTFADISLAMSQSNAAPATGSTVTYTLTVANSGTSTDPASVVVRDALPSGLSFVSATASAGSYNSTTGDWSVGTLGIGSNATLTITAIVTAGSGTSVTNTAEVFSSTITDIDSTPNNGAAGEDDRATATLTANATRTAGTAPTLTCSAGSALFDWDSQTWSAGSTSNNYTLTGIGAFNFAITNPGTFLNNATYGGQSPARQTANNGGFSGQNSLVQLVDMANTSQVVTTTISLGTAAQGAQFRILDVDYAAGQFADMATVTGYLNGNAVSPTLTNGVTNYVLGNSAYGDGTSADGSANGNIVVTFNSPIDQIVVQYGNHSLAPSNPGQQAITLHDFTLCRPVPNVSVTKVSSVLSDPVNGTTNPKAIPGAVMDYCILITNNGTATLTSLAVSDTLPANFTYAAGTMTSGSNCASATTAEDDNNAGADESDPHGASISAGVLGATASTLTASSSFALKFRGTVN